MRVVEHPKHLHDGGAEAAAGERIDKLLEALSAHHLTRKRFSRQRIPSAEVCGYSGSKFFIGHDFVLPHSLPWGEAES